MTTHTRTIVAFFAVLIAAAWAQESKPAGVVETGDLKSLVPSTFFYRGKSAAVQLRNSGAIRTKDQKYVIAGMVDTAGYASNIAEKYQGLLITEVELKIEGSKLKPGQYGFGFAGDKFVVTDVGANDVLSVSSKRDDNLKRAMPLKIAKEGDDYRLYAGKKFVTLKIE